ncbi:hypothetical protein [Streptomyces tanashiensis]|uniref:hypothetical protein n=1 Tax=Streptomyces tanashiensis TaxID=67367 RepID=UPI0027E4C7BA|nr:hypothetical protein [Streptomyces tanashiensis]
MYREAGQGGRWRAGRLVLAEDGLVWKPFRGRSPVRLPDDLRVVEARRVTPREAVSLSPRAEILVCESAQREILLGILPEHHDLVASRLAG